MIDAPGPWGTGPFTLAEGRSTLDTELVTIGEGPLAATYLWREDRSPRLRLVANTGYWDRKRGPRLREVIFRNDVTLERALELVCTTEGEVDIVTEISPADAARVEDSEHARLVSIDALRAVFGIIDREAEGLPLADRRARLALNLAIDRSRLVDDALFGHAKPLAGLNPPSGALSLDRVLPPFFSSYSHEPERASELWRETVSGDVRPIRLAAPDTLERVARRVADDLRAALDNDVEVTLLDGRETLDTRRRLAERSRPHAWDVLIWQHAPQAADSAVLELHRAVVGVSGEYRAGPIVAGFEELYARLVSETSRLKMAPIAHRIDHFVHEEALALFLCAPSALYAVNKHVSFKAYRTTFELAECSVSDEHWSRRAQRPPPAKS